MCMSLRRHYVPLDSQDPKPRPAAPAASRPARRKADADRAARRRYGASSWIGGGALFGGAMAVPDAGGSASACGADGGG